MELPPPSGSASGKEPQGEDRNQPIQPLGTASISRVEDNDRNELAAPPDIASSSRVDDNDRNEPALPSDSESSGSSENDDHKELVPAQLHPTDQYSINQSAYDGRKHGGPPRLRKFVGINHTPIKEAKARNGGVLPFSRALITSSHPYATLWSSEKLPEILFYLQLPVSRYINRPIRPLLEANRAVTVKDPSQKKPHQVKFFEILPRHISLEVPGWLVEAWRRTDVRIGYQDILDRQEADDTLHLTKLKKNALQNHTRRECRKILNSWVEYGRRGEPHRTEVEAIEHLSYENVVNNTTLNVCRNFPNRLNKVRLVKKHEDGIWYAEPFFVTRENYLETTLPLNHFQHQDYEKEMTPAMEAAFEMYLILMERAELHGLDHWSKLDKQCLPVSWFDRVKEKTTGNDSYDGGCSTCTWISDADRKAGVVVTVERLPAKPPGPRAIKRERSSSGDELQFTKFPRTPKRQRLSKTSSRGRMTAPEPDMRPPHTPTSLTPADRLNQQTVPAKRRSSHLASSERSLNEADEYFHDDDDYFHDDDDYFHDDDDYIDEGYENESAASPIDNEQPAVYSRDEDYDTGYKSENHDQGLHELTSGLLDKNADEDIVREARLRDPFRCRDVGSPLKTYGDHPSHLPHGDADAGAPYTGYDLSGIGDVFDTPEVGVEAYRHDLGDGEVNGLDLASGSVLEPVLSSHALTDVQPAGLWSNDWPHDLTTFVGGAGRAAVATSSFSSSLMPPAMSFSTADTGYDTAGTSFGHGYESGHALEPAMPPGTSLDAEPLAADDDIPDDIDDFFPLTATPMSTRHPDRRFPYSERPRRHGWPSGMTSTRPRRHSDNEFDPFSLPALVSSQEAHEEDFSAFVNDVFDSTDLSGSADLFGAAADLF